MYGYAGHGHQLLQLFGCAGSLTGMERPTAQAGLLWAGGTMQVAPPLPVE